MKAYQRCLRMIRLVCVIACASLVSSCVWTLQEACHEAWNQKDPTLTDDQQLALFYGAKGVGCIHDSFFAIKNGKPEIAYQKVALSKLIIVEKKQLDDLKQILDPKNESWWKLLEETRFRPYLELQERALQWRVARMELVLNHEEFRKLMGEIDASAMERNPKRTALNVQIFLPEFDPANDTPFRAKYIEEARKSGKLLFISKFVFFDYERLGKKESDLAFLKDPKRFVWEKIVEGLEINLYKVMDSPRPYDKKPSYLEATRIAYELDQEGRTLGIRRESKPALRIFASGSEDLDVVVLDTDREGEIGFGLPDVVERLGRGITTNRELFLQQQPFLAQLFTEKNKSRRFPPPSKEQRFEAVEAGTAFDPWEKSPVAEGWSIPFSYKSEAKDNYHLEIVLKKKAPQDTSSLRQIDAIKKVYHSPTSEWRSVKGEVVEYYRAKSEFAGKILVEARIDYSNRKKIMIEPEGKPSTSGIITPVSNGFIHDAPFRIDYTEGDTRWRLEDRDASDIFMYRREISRSGSDDIEEARSSISHHGGDYP